MSVPAGNVKKEEKRMKSKMVQVGAAWKKTSSNDKQFVSINITNPVGPDFHFSLWSNSYKKEEGQPDYIVYKSVEDRTEAKPQAKPESEFPGDNEANSNEDVPF
jgi:uncharacterized protein (DUF736 family)